MSENTEEGKSGSGDKVKNCVSWRSQPMKICYQQKEYKGERISAIKKKACLNYAGVK